ncbi:efflux RND transporter periplasmic adaptor subunit [Rhizobium terrae]|uniref:efflux RND transporter periplasmic adaptor subunit n=1 Tax=Rhizobium terrae TaxID=2171756 RepID=UPI000E3EC677|nr:efflux RND transporter periplasmic adaptor subunit [Rhizobium terrae]
MPVTVYKATRNSVIERIPVVGSFAAREEIQVHSAVLGKEIQHILVEVGQSVRKGQPLALLDTTDVLMQLDKNAVSLFRANAAIAVEGSKVEVAMVAEAEARKRLERSRALQPKGAIADQVLDEHQNAYARALAELKLAQQALGLAKADADLIAHEKREIELAIERSTVRAPSAGKILSRNARIGTMTSSSAEPLFVIAEDGVMEFMAQVTETSFVRLSEGMHAEITISGRDDVIEGTLRLNAAQLDSNTRNGTVRIELSENGNLIPGVFARGIINTSERKSILVPGTAVKSTRGMYSVYVVTNNVIDVRRVSVGLRQDGFVEISDGVEDGELVVLKAASFLKAEERVTPVIANLTKVEPHELSASASFPRAEEMVRQ